MLRNSCTYTQTIFFLSILQQFIVLCIIQGLWKINALSSCNVCTSLKPVYAGFSAALKEGMKWHEMVVMCSGWRKKV